MRYYDNNRNLCTRFHPRLYNRSSTNILACAGNGSESPAPWQHLNTLNRPMIDKIAYVYNVVLGLILLGLLFLIVVTIISVCAAVIIPITIYELVAAPMRGYPR